MATSRLQCVADLLLSNSGGKAHREVDYNNIMFFDVSEWLVNYMANVGTRS